MWDAVSGGNQIQSITLQQSGGAPTNQIASVTTNPGGSTVNWVYDAAGNVTNDGMHTYQYDSENRIVSVDGGSTGSYAYDNQNRRYKKTVGSAVTHYVWQGSQVLSEHNGGTGAVLIDYVYSGGRMLAKVASGTTPYFLSDRLSVRLLLDTSGNVIGRQGHLPFGEDFGESGTQEKHHFTSYERDGESTTDYALNRYYAPHIGIFRSVDPVADVGFRASRASGCRDKPTMKEFISNPQALQRYAYTRNDALNKIDPLGLIPWGWKCAWKVAVCLSALATYIQGWVLIAQLCAETVGVGCLLALLWHPLTAGFVLDSCSDAIRTCRLVKDTDGNWTGPVGKGFFDWGDILTWPCFGFNCDPFRTGEWEKSVIETDIQPYS